MGNLWCNYFIKWGCHSDSKRILLLPGIVMATENFQGMCNMFFLSYQCFYLVNYMQVVCNESWNHAFITPQPSWILFPRTDLKFQCVSDLILTSFKIFNIFTLLFLQQRHGEYFNILCQYIIATGSKTDNWSKMSGSMILTCKGTKCNIFCFW